MQQDFILANKRTLDLLLTVLSMEDAQSLQLRCVQYLSRALQTAKTRYNKQSVANFIQ